MEGIEVAIDPAEPALERIMRNPLKLVQTAAPAIVQSGDKSFVPSHVTHTYPQLQISISSQLHDYLLS